MYRTVSDAQVEKEASSGYKPPAIESGVMNLPLSELGDREFELLVYLLIKAEIEAGSQLPFTSISLMQAVGERGRDCVLYSNEAVAAVVQCKKYANRLSRPQVLKELIKFLLFSTLDQSILPDPNNFEYKLYVSNDLSEPAITLINSYTSEIQKDISSNNIFKYVSDLVAEYESFSAYRNHPPVKNVVELLKRIRVSYCTSTDLTTRIHHQKNILNNFFRVQKVISLEGADTLIRTAMDDYGVRFLTDDDLKALQTRIGSIPKEYRIKLGMVDFFGFNLDFFRYLNGAKLQELLDAIVSITKVLDKELFNFLISEIDKYVLERITLKLLSKGIIHPFSVGIATPYLFKRLAHKIITRTMPERLVAKYHPESKMTKEELVTEISEVLFESSSRVMAGDYSHLVGNEDEVELKLRLYEHMHRDLTTIEDAKAVLHRDMKVIMPTLEQIELDISKKIWTGRTVVIKDAGFLDDETQVINMVDTIREIEKG